MNREGQVWKRSWASAPFVVLETKGSTVHLILYLDEGEPRWEGEHDRGWWEERHDMTRIA